MPRGVKKENLPTKVCVSCKKAFTWRKKWENCWDEVTTCSKRCNGERKKAKRQDKLSKKLASDNSVAAKQSVKPSNAKNQQQERLRRLRGGGSTDNPGINSIEVSNPPKTSSPLAIKDLEIASYRELEGKNYLQNRPPGCLERGVGPDTSPPASSNGVDNLTNVVPKSFNQVELTRDTGKKPTGDRRKGGRESNRCGSEKIKSFSGSDDSETGVGMSSVAWSSLFLVGLGLSEAIRFELYFKTSVELMRQIPFLKRHGITRVNLPNKGKHDGVADWCSDLVKAYSDVEVCPHYSLKNQYYGGPEQTFQKFESFCKRLTDIGIQECLVVSGGGRKRKSDLSTLSCLQMIEKRKSSPARHLKLGVAFNPYFPDDADRRNEQKVLRRKLETGQVGSVWLQIGCDTTFLTEGLDFLYNALEDLELRGRVDVYASVFLPSPKLLNQMRFRPWNGVFLSEENLSSTDSATSITKKILRTYAAYGVRVLCETALRSDTDIARFSRLLEPYASELSKDAEGKQQKDADCSNPKASPPRRPNPELDPLGSVRQGTDQERHQRRSQTNQGEQAKPSISSKSQRRPRSLRATPRRSSGRFGLTKMRGGMSSASGLRSKVGRACGSNKKQKLQSAGEGDDWK